MGNPYIPTTDSVTSLTYYSPASHSFEGAFVP